MRTLALGGQAGMTRVHQGHCFFPTHGGDFTLMLVWVLVEGLGGGPYGVYTAIPAAAVER